MLSNDDKEWIHQQIHDHEPSGCLQWVILFLCLLMVKLLGGC
jgi:hypothetical protein